MIGNTIIFNKYKYKYIGDCKLITCEFDVTEGIVVDAYTEVKGHTSGESFLGFGETEGKTSSKRIYKVQYFEGWDSYKRLPQLMDIQDWMVVKIISINNSLCQESQNQ